MKRTQLWIACGAAIALAASWVTLRGAAGRHPQEPSPGAGDDITGTVTSAKGPEAGVWVIAETTDLPTRFVRIVVTDDRGRYVVPDLPAGEYDVWVRGYGLVDSAKVKSAPGKVVNLKAVAAPDKKAAAQYYPAQYWYALLQVPPKSDFPGTGDKGNGISPNIKSQGEWIRNIVNTDGCTGCHQMGGPATRTIPLSILKEFEDTTMAWERRIQSGQAGGGISDRIHDARQHGGHHHRVRHAQRSRRGSEVPLVRRWRRQGRLRAARALQPALAVHAAERRHVGAVPG